MSTMREPHAFGDVYQRRVIDTELDELFRELPAILLDGPKAVGKTATAVNRAQTIRRLDHVAERDIVAARSEEHTSELQSH